MSFKKILLIGFSVLFLFSSIFISCKGKKSGDEKLKVKHKVVLEHVKFDDNNNGLIYKLGDDNAVKATPKTPSTTVEELYYVDGVLVAQNLKESMKNFDVDVRNAKVTPEQISAFIQGVIDGLASKELDQEYLNDLSGRLTALANETDEKRAELGKAYFETLKQNAESEGIKITESGLMYKIIAEGQGDYVFYDDAVVNLTYTMSVYDEFAEGKKVVADKSEEGTDFPVNGLISGLIEGIKYMNEGAEFEFYIKPELGYGQRWMSEVIMPNSYLIFRCKLNKIVKVSESGLDQPQSEEGANVNADSNESEPVLVENTENTIE